MPDWVAERGIGECRMARIEGDQIVEARILVDGIVRAGSMLEARLKSVGRNAVATAAGEEYLLPAGAPGATEGAALRIEVSRERLAGAEPWKRPLARVAGEARIVAEPAATALAFPAPDDQLEAAGWSDLLDEARSGIVAFPGGELRIAPTPAMTLIDVDGQLPPAELAVAGAAAAARAILRLDIGGSIGIDLPTAGSKQARSAAAEAVDRVLPKPFERTAVNGFGFLQIVRPRIRASLVEIAADRASFEARALLRRAVREVGGIMIVAHPAVIALIEAHPEWIETLGRQVGGSVGLRADPALGMEAGNAVRH